MNKMIKLFLTFALIGLFSCKNVTIHELNDNNFDTEVKDGHVNPWLLIFSLKTCPHCVNANDAITKMSVSNDFGELDVSLGQIDCNANVMSCMRFNITRVPYIVYVHKNKMFEFDSLPTEHSLLKFIKEEKTLESVKPLPVAYSYISLIFKLMGDTVVIANEYFGDYVNNKLGYKVNWTSEYTIGLFVLGMVLLVMVEYLILTICCVKKRNKPTAPADTTTTTTTEEHAKKD
jgi:hypothetical protein